MFLSVARFNISRAGIAQSRKRQFVVFQLEPFGDEFV